MQEKTQSRSMTGTPRTNITRRIDLTTLQTVPRHLRGRHADARRRSAKRSRSRLRASACSNSNRRVGAALFERHRARHGRSRRPAKRCCITRAASLRDIENIGIELAEHATRRARLRADDGQSVRDRRIPARRPARVSFARTSGQDRPGGAPERRRHSRRSTDSLADLGICSGDVPTRAGFSGSHYRRDRLVIVMRSRSSARERARRIRFAETLD